MIFENEEVRTKFHLLDTDTQVFYYELEGFLALKGKQLFIGGDESELILRIV